MSFMQPQIEFGEWWEIESTHGTEFVPGDLFTDDCVTLGDTYDRENCSWFDDLTDGLQDYVEGDIESVKRIKGYGARMSAPGYLDCTDWCVFETEQEARDYLKETYGEDEK